MTECFYLLDLPGELLRRPHLPPMVSAPQALPATGNPRRAGMSAGGNALRRATAKDAGDPKWPDYPDRAARSGPMGAWRDDAGRATTIWARGAGMPLRGRQAIVGRRRGADLQVVWNGQVLGSP